MALISRGISKEEQSLGDWNVSKEFDDIICAKPTPMLSYGISFISLVLILLICSAKLVPYNELFRSSVKALDIYKLEKPEKAYYVKAEIPLSKAANLAPGEKAKLNFYDQGTKRINVLEGKILSTKKITDKKETVLATIAFVMTPIIEKRLNEDASLIIEVQFVVNKRSLFDQIWAFLKKSFIRT